MTLLGDALGKLKRCESAADWYRRALAIDPTNAVAHHRLAKCLLAAGRPADALRHNLDALQTRADYVEAMHAATLSLLELGQWRRARIMVDRAIKTKATPELLDLRRCFWRFRARRYLNHLLHPFGHRANQPR